jgi:membrane protease YdiL (CAAX protease family)
MEFAIFGIVVAGSIIYAANLYQINQMNVRLLNALLLMVATLGIVMGGSIALIAVTDTMAGTAALPAEQAETVAQVSQIDIPTAFVFLLVSLIVGILSMVIIISRDARLWIARVIIRGDGVNRRYHPDAVVHTTAIVLALFEIVNVVGGFILAGGIEGIAAELAENISIEMLFSGLLTYLLLALLGVGLFIRRDLPQTLQRLALDSVTLRQLVIGAGVGFGMFWIVSGLEVAWMLVVSPELFAEQSAAAEQLFLAFSGSLLAAFLLALTSSIGEEILFRGALQPIFGIFWTSLFFTLLHTQYIFTPASLLIFGVSLIFGWQRLRYNTMTAIVAHFVYNFVPFVLYWLFTQTPTVESVLR